MRALLKWLAGLPAAAGRWWSYHRLVAFGPGERDCQRSPASHRDRLRRAARAAFLETLSPNQRALALRPYGDQR